MFSTQSRVHSLRVFVVCLLPLLVSSGFTQTLSGKTLPAPPNQPDRLQKVIRDVVDATVQKFGSGGLSAQKVALTLIEFKDREQPVWASHRGQEQTYPASVVKLFYLAAAHHQMAAGELKSTPELERALHDMIVDSSNDATHYVVDALTGTTDGLELDERALADWMYKRNSVNRYFAGLGYEK